MTYSGLGPVYPGQAKGDLVELVVAHSGEFDVEGLVRKPR